MSVRRINKDHAKHRLKIGQLAVRSRIEQLLAGTELALAKANADKLLEAVVQLQGEDHEETQKLKANLQAQSAKSEMAYTEQLRTFTALCNETAVYEFIRNSTAPPAGVCSRSWLSSIYSDPGVELMTKTGIHITQSSTTDSKDGKKLLSKASGSKISFKRNRHVGKENISP